MDLLELATNAETNHWPPHLGVTTDAEKIAYLAERLREADGANNAELERLESRVEELEEETVDLQNDIDNRDDQIEKLEEKVSDLQTQVVELKAQVGERS